MASIRAVALALVPSLRNGNQLNPSPAAAGASGQPQVSPLLSEDRSAADSESLWGLKKKLSTLYV